MPVTCPYCKKHFPCSDVVNSRHKAVCSGWNVGAKVIPCLCGHKSTSLTQMKRHRSTCEVWKSRHRGTVQMERLANTLSANHGEGITHPMHVQGAKENQKKTNLARYGAENVFEKSSSLYESIRKSSRERHRSLCGQDNPFSWPEVQEKIRETNLERYGAPNPQQVPEIREKTRVTNTERYGVPETLSDPGVREKIRVTNQIRYGGPAPSNSPEVVEKVRDTNLDRWGVEWTCQHPAVRQKQYEAMLDRYGSHFFASEEGRRVVRGSLTKKYGVPHPMMNPETALKALESARRPGPNQVERLLHSLAPELIYTGDGTFWRWLPKIGHHKNPDFILSGEDPTNPKRGVTRVVELFGDYWHSRMFTGKASFEHETELIDAYADIGIQCLVVWESDIRKNKDGVKVRLSEFLSV